MNKAIKTGRVPFEKHLRICRSCHDEFEMLRKFGVAGQSEMRGLSTSTIDRLAAIPLLYGSSRPVRRIAGSVIFDSWASQSTARLRDAGPGLTRRICLKADSIRLEIIAERRQNGWEFVGRVYEGQEVSAGYILKVGRRKLLPQSQGFLQWSSKGGPRSLRLVSRTGEIVFEGLSWL